MIGSFLLLTVIPMTTAIPFLNQLGNDSDGDGYRSSDDCNDNDNSIYPEQSILSMASFKIVMIHTGGRDSMIRPPKDCGIGMGLLRIFF